MTDNDDQFGGGPYSRPREAVLAESLSWAEHHKAAADAECERLRAELERLRERVKKVERLLRDGEDHWTLMAGGAREDQAAAEDTQNYVTAAARHATADALLECAKVLGEARALLAP